MQNNDVVYALRDCGGHGQLSILAAEGAVDLATIFSPITKPLLLLFLQHLRLRCRVLQISHAPCKISMIAIL